MSEASSELTPQEQALLRDVGQRLQEQRHSLTTGWERTLDDILTAEGVAARKTPRQVSIEAAYAILQTLSAGQPAEGWRQGRAYGEAMAMQGFGHTFLGKWLSALRQSLLTTLSQSYDADPQLDLAIVALSKFLALYMFQVTESFSSRQQRLLLEQQEALRQAYEQAQRRVVELEVLNEVGQAISATTDLDHLLVLVYEQTSRLMDTSNFYIALCDWERRQLRFELDIEEGVRQPQISLAITQGLTGYIVHNRQPLLFPQGPQEFLEEQGIERIGRPACSWLGVPMIIHDRVVGVLAVQSYTQEGAYDDGHQRILSTIASQAAVAVANARLFQEARRRAEEMEALYRIGAASAAHLSLAEICRSVHEQAGVVMDTSAFFIALYDRERNEISFELMYDQGEMTAPFRVKKEERGGLTGWVLDHNETLCIGNWDEAPEEVRSVAIPMGEPVRSWLGVPLVVRGQATGVIAAQSYRNDAFDERHRQVLEMLAHQAAAAIENARLFEETRRRLEELQVLDEVGRAISSTMELDDLIELIYRQTGRLMDTTSFFLVLYDREHELLDFCLQYEEGERQPRRTRALGVGLTGYIVHHKEPLFFPYGPSEFQKEQGIALVGRPAVSWLGVPMIVQDHVVGVLAVQSYTQPGAYDEGHRRVLMTIASQAAVAVENARLYQEARRQVDEMEALYRIGATSAARLSLDEICHSIYEQASVVMDTSAFFVALYDRESDEIVFQLDYEEGESAGISRISKSQQGGLTGWVLDHRESLIIHEWDKTSPELRQIAIVQGEEDDNRVVHSWLGVPMVVRGEAIGVIAAQSYRPHAFDDRHRQVLETIARQAAAALENARLYQEAQRRVAQLSALRQVGLKLAETTDLDETLNTVADATMELFQASDILIFLYDAVQDAFSLGAGLNAQGERGLLAPMPRQDGLTATVAHTAQLMVVEDVPNHPLYRDSPQQTRDLCSIASVPLIRAGQVLGVLNIAYYDPHHFTPEELRLLQALSDQSAVAVGNARLFQKMQTVMQELQETAEAQYELLRLVQDLSTPVVPLAAGILLMPLVGSIDSARGSQTLERLLQAVEQQQAQIVLVDITGVPVVDTSVAQILLQSVQAVSFLGAEAVLVGIRPEVAQTLVSLGVKLSGITTRADLQSGVAYAMRRVRSRQGQVPGLAGPPREKMP